MGTSEAGDQFGCRVVLAPPGLSDSKTRMAVSAPNEDGAAADTGLAQIFPLDDLDAEATYEQAPGDAAANEHFGEGLGFVAGVAERAVLVGVPDNVQNTTGMVNVIPLPTGSPRSWIPGSGGLPSIAGADRFGGGAGGEVQ